MSERISPQDERFVCIGSTTAWNGMAFMCSRPDPHPLEGKHWGQDRRSGFVCEWTGDKSARSELERRVEYELIDGENR